MSLCLPDPLPFQLQGGRANKVPRFRWVADKVDLV